MLLAAIEKALRHRTPGDARPGAGREETPEIVFAAAATALRQPAVARDGALR